jgi:hypothetical protein
MQDGSDDGDNGRPEAPAGGPDEEREYPADRLRRRLQTRLGGRPVMVYLVLFAGAAVLLVLLGIVWLSATGGGGEERPPCFDISADEARGAILAGSVERIEIFVDRDQFDLGPSVVRLDLTDNTCRELPKGADNALAAYQIVGVAEVYNNTHGERIRLTYHRTDVLPEFLVTSTPTPTITPTPTETPVSTETPASTESPTAAPGSPTAAVAPTSAPTETPTLAPTATPVVSDPASPSAG